ncbi:unnamed protein product, partial [Adineta steineri]
MNIWIYAILYFLPSIKSIEYHDETTTEKSITKTVTDSIIIMKLTQSFRITTALALSETGSLLTSSDNDVSFSYLDLALGLGLAIPLLLLFTGLIICGCCCQKYQFLSCCTSKFYRYFESRKKTTQNHTESTEKFTNKSTSHKDLSFTNDLKDTEDLKFTNELDNNQVDKVANDKNDLELANNSENNTNLIVTSEPNDNKNLTTTN